MRSNLFRFKSCWTFWFDSIPGRDKSRNLIVARLEGFEPPTARFVAEYSIQLSYSRAFSKFLLAAN